ncbi:MAG TPA: protoporphyrinogen oxidase [Candidatus Acidoferrales bacterium]|nr:protoporphyrinogen oxidase [Candidatus Acidoferrales bacterium]
MADAKQAIVIGGGISGLACATRLRKLGVPVILLEAAERAGGLIGTAEQDGFLFETGPQSFQATNPLLELIRELGIEGELCKADPRAPRWVLRHGRLQKIPMSPQALLTSSVIGLGTRWKVASEAFQRTRAPSEDESVADFVRRKFGHEILEYLVSPFVSGVYAGDPEKLSLKAAFPTLEEWEREYGSVLRGAMKSRPAATRSNGGVSKGPPPLCTFRRGMGVLIEAMAKGLGASLRTGTRAESLTRATDAAGRCQVRVSQNGREETINAGAVVMAAPAYAASRLLGPVSARLAKALSGIVYAPVAVVGSGYYAHQSAASLDGFGVLIPRSEAYRTLGIVWNTSLFGVRGRAGQMALTSFVGGATDPEIVEKSEAEILAIVQDENARILGVTGPPITSGVWKHPKALPQYNLGHSHTVRAIREGEREIPGLFFAGNYLEGPSIGKCVEHASLTADAVRASL